MHPSVRRHRERKRERAANLQTHPKRSLGFWPGNLVYSLVFRAYSFSQRGFRVDRFSMRLNFFHFQYLKIPLNWGSKDRNDLFTYLIRSTNRISLSLGFLSFFAARATIPTCPSDRSFNDWLSLPRRPSCTLVNRKPQVR